jgi:hypothetical protein
MTNIIKLKTETDRMANEWCDKVIHQATKDLDDVANKIDDPMERLLIICAIGCLLLHLQGLLPTVAPQELHKRIDLLDKLLDRDHRTWQKKRQRRAR